MVFSISPHGLVDYQSFYSAKLTYVHNWFIAWQQYNASSDHNAV
jgi:hypothetical protein